MQLHYTYNGTRYEGFRPIDRTPSALPDDCQLAIVWDEGTVEVYAVEGKAGADNLVQYLRESWYGHPEDWIAPPFLMVAPTADAVRRAKQQQRRITAAMRRRAAEWAALTDEERAERLSTPH